MSLILEGIINCDGLYMATNTDFTYQQSTLVSNPWSQKHQSCNKKIYLKNKAQSYWNLDWAGTLIQAQSGFQNKKCWLGEMETVSSSTSRRLFYKLSLRNFRKSHCPTGWQIDRPNSGFCNKFFLVWQKYQIKGQKVGGITILKLPEKRWRSLWEGIN